LIDISRIKEIRFNPNPSTEKLDIELFNPLKSNGAIKSLEDQNIRRLDSKIGCKLAKDNSNISAYDESFNKYFSLAGSGLLTSHSLIVHGKSDYLSLNNLTFYFYTRSDEISNKSEFIRKSTDLELDSRRDYATDRTEFISEAAPSNSVIFIDGPLLAGVNNPYNIKMNEALLKKNTIPIFIVKNSNSNIVTEYFPDLRKKFNSDMHWAYTLLPPGSRTSFFVYEDNYNEEFSKIFCYLKSFDISPQRIEFHVNTFEKYQNILLDLMHLIYYLVLVQGNYRNPQVRSIAIAEKFARETLDLFDMSNLMKSLGLVPTMNQERGFGG
jgi:hypothetical protein